jgi:transposase
MRPTSNATLPEDPAALRHHLHSAYQTIERLENESAWLKRQVFGRKADAVPAAPSPEAQDLFAADAPKAQPQAEETETITYARRKKGHGRRPFPESLPRVEEVVEPKEADKLCSHCGKPKSKIGEDVCEVLEHIPQKFFVRKITRPKYACPLHAEEGVCRAAPPARFIPKGNVGEGLLAEVLLSKYVNHMPLSRQEKNFRRMGVDIAVSTMVGWMAAATEKRSPIVAAMQNSILKGDIAFSDDTTLPVLREDKKGGCHRGYLWVYSDGGTAVVFEYTPGRGQEGPKAFLNGFQGFLHSDAYAVYDCLHEKAKITPAFCWSHARRKFVRALESGEERARRAVQLIGRLFLVDRYARVKAADAQATPVLRGRVSTGILAALKGYLKKIGPFVLPQSALGEAIAYVDKRWEGFSTFLTDGRLSLDNNFSERQIRQVVLGRRNHHFAGSEEGARRAAILYSLVCSCKILGLDPWKYPAHVLATLAETPDADPPSLTPAGLQNQLL